MKHAQVIARTVRRLLTVAFLGTTFGSDLQGQTVAIVSVPTTAIAIGTAQRCNLNVRDAGQNAQLDTIIVRITDDTGTKLVPSKATIEVFLDRDSILNIAPGTDSILTTLDAGTLTGRTLAIKNKDVTKAFCIVGVRPRPPEVITNANVARLIARDSAELDSVRAVRKLRGSSYVILSLIKSIAGRKPQDEFFDLRMKFGGERSYDLNVWKWT